MCVYDLREKTVGNIVSSRLVHLEGLGLKRNQLIVPEEDMDKGSRL